ncbi:MAG: hypothetical protein ACOCWG_03045 [bacterium]
MKKLIVSLIIISSCISLFSQNSFQADTIVRLGGRNMIVDILQVTNKYLSYKYPDEDEIRKIERKQVQKVIYNDGKIEIFNPPIFEMIEETQWEAVLVTENKEDVEGLYNRGKVDAISSPSSRSKKAAKKSATIRLQKKTVNKGGIIILVTHKEFRGGYGEMPGYFIEGLVYGTEPLEQEEEGKKEQGDDEGVILDY